MTGLIADALAWWSGGDLLMPVMLAVSLALYAMLADRSMRLWGARRQDRADGLRAAIRAQPEGVRRAAAIRACAIADADALARGSALILALAAALPLLGLLGTVTGMIGTFHGLGAGGSAARHAGSGISLALTATQYGMALAVPAILWERLLAQRASALALDRELLVRETAADGSGS